MGTFGFVFFVAAFFCSFLFGLCCGLCINNLAGVSLLAPLSAGFPLLPMRCDCNLYTQRVNSWWTYVFYYALRRPRCRCVCAFFLAYAITCVGIFHLDMSPYFSISIYAYFMCVLRWWVPLSGNWHREYIFNAYLWLYKYWVFVVWWLFSSAAYFFRVDQAPKILYPHFYANLFFVASFLFVFFFNFSLWLSGWMDGWI